jgi:hypothetical protein
MTLATFEAAWNSFDEDVLRPHEVTPLQRTNMKSAFYAGAMSFYTVLTNEPDPHDQTTAAAELAKIEGLLNELNLFHLSLLAGEP